MRPMFAMAGPAEAALMMIVAIAYGGLLVVACLAAAAYWRRSWILATVAIVLMLAFTAMFQPWDCFDAYAVNPMNTSDPDARYFAWHALTFGFAWAIELTATMLSLPFAMIGRRRSRTSV